MGTGSYGVGARQPWARETLLAGLIGAGVVALWFLLVDVVRDRILFTPAALGSAIFRGARGVEQVEISAATVLGYTLVHIVAFMAVAFVASWLIRSAEREPRALLGAALLFVTMEVFVIGVLAIAATWLLDALSLWTVGIANLLAALAMGLFLWNAHPALQHELRVNLEEAQ